jgi:hypothetical protein
MASENRESRRPAIDPLMDAALEGVAAGYRGVGYVAEGMTESIRRRSGSEFTRDGGSGRSGSHRSARDSGTASFVGEIAALTADLFDRLSETAEEIAGELGTRHERHAERTLELSGKPGAAPSLTFRLTNTGPAALTELDFEATDLIGPAGRIDARAVDFANDQKIDRIRSGGYVEVHVAIAIPEQQEAGTYRGVITTRAATRRARSRVTTGPRDAWAVLELEVVEAAEPPPKDIAGERAEEPDPDRVEEKLEANGRKRRSGRS